MSFLPKEPDTFINIKLTDDGRRLLSLGALTFAKATFSDREINYGIDRTGSYDIINNRILAPKDYQPANSINYDGSNPVVLTGQQLGSFKKIVSATTVNGLFSGTTDNWMLTPSLIKGRGVLDYLVAGQKPVGTNTIDVSSLTVTPSVGDLMFVQWETNQGVGKIYDPSTKLDPESSNVSTWYRINAVVPGSPATITVDRNLPDFGATPTSQNVNVYFYPFDGIETYYGTGYTTEAKVWNMNIVRTSSVPGTDSSMAGYVSYGSIEYNGFKKYLGFSAETREIGIIHYTNHWTGNTYAEQLGEKSVVIDLPTILWHKYPANIGEAKKYGVELTDFYGDTIFDTASQTTYRELRDGTSSTSIVVGRVYHKLKVFVITDPELLTAMTYKSNRSYTLPQTNLTLVQNPKYPLSTSNATGLCTSGKTYYVTYGVESDTTYAPNVSFGYPKVLPCAYISRISGQLDSSNNPQFLSVTFPNNSFPYLRSSTNMSAASYSGSGWNANKVQIFVNEVSNDALSGLDTIPSDGWIKVSNGAGNGIYTGDITDTTIDPLKLSGYQFILSREDFTSGTTYTLDPTFHDNNDSTTGNGLNFGDEAMFFGSISVGTIATAYKTVITIYAKNTEFNATTNTSFDVNQDKDIYITEVSILSDTNEVVAVGKPSYPIKKNSSKYLAFQLEIDF